MPATEPEPPRLLPSLPPLPVDALLPEIAALAQTHPCLVIEAPPGAGKTTRVPHALLHLWPDGDIVVLEPRRLAAHLSAARVAEERGEPLGQSVGVQMRWGSVTGPSTRLRFVTEGVLLRQLLGDPTLRGVRAVVLDEFHERHLHADLALALVRRLQQTARPDLRILVMSATMPGAQVAAFLGGCPVVRSEGRTFEVTIQHQAQPSSEPVSRQVRQVLAQHLRDEAVRVSAGEPVDRGDVLLFLPGSAEIRRCQEDLAELAERHALELLPLHGDLPLDAQRRAVAPRAAGARRKVILSTNVAETSVTVDGVTVVVDSGLARVASHSPWSGLPRLRVQPICRAAAAQRAGRAGRTRPGVCLRLYTRYEHDQRPEFEIPEMRRLDLAETVLWLRAAGLEPQALPFMDPPTPAALDAAHELLERLGAIGGAAAGRTLTPLGARLARLPLHPRLGRLLLAGAERGLLDEAATVCALLSERDVRVSQRGASLLGGGGGRPGVPAGARASEPSDVLHLLERFESARAARFSSQALYREGLDEGAVHAVERARSQLVRIESGGRRATPPAGEAARERALLASVLAAYPDRVARRRARPGTSEAPEFVLCGGGTAALLPTSLVREAEWAVLVDVEEQQPGAGRSPQTPAWASARAAVRLASAIEPDWLLELPGDHVHETVQPVWHETAERVDVVRRLQYDGLVLDESRQPGDGSDAAQVALLLEHVEADRLRAFRDGEDVARLSARLALVAQHAPDLGLSPPTPAQIQAAARALCTGRASFAELGSLSLTDALCAVLRPDAPGSVLPTLARLLPEHVTLPRGRRVRVNYDGQAPFIESRLQDFFGMSEGPRILGGRVPLVIHLLAPNQRAVQVTTDLAGFWVRHYPAIRRELSRRYPRHAWPEDPLAG